MKKIKSRFFKFFANQYMINFSNYINKQTAYKLDFIFFKRLKTYFLVYATIDKHKQWKFFEKSIFELFYDHSDMNFKQLHNIFTNDPEKFTQLTDGLDEVTKFVILQPLKIVYNKFLADKELQESFLEKVKEDIIKRKSLFSNDKVNTYYEVFKTNLFYFVEYYTND